MKHLLLLKYNTSKATEKVFKTYIKLEKGFCWQKWAARMEAWVNKAVVVMVWDCKEKVSFTVFCI